MRPQDKPCGRTRSAAGERPRACSALGPDGLGDGVDDDGHGLPVLVRRGLEVASDLMEVREVAIALLLQEIERRGRPVVASRPRLVAARRHRPMLAGARRLRLGLLHPCTIYRRFGSGRRVVVLFFNDTATTEIYTLSLHDALPIRSALPRRLAMEAVSTMLPVEPADRY